jgi:hypothetical protein
MYCELGLRFDDPAHVVVFLNEDGRIQSAAAQTFSGPIDRAAQRDLRWYLEVYPVHYMTELDDARAAEIGQRIKEWGQALFYAVFADRVTQRLFDRFQEGKARGRLLTVTSDHPAVLAQPWELLCDPTGTYVFLDEPRISVRRQLPSADGGRRPFNVVAKDRLHLLFVVSRPKDEGFIDPRADPRAVMDAIETEVPGRVTYEFLRPATVAEFIKRLDDTVLPAIDVLHFDGHGAYDTDGALAEQARRIALGSGSPVLLRDAPTAGEHRGYLFFENDDGSSVPVAASMLGDLLNHKHVGLVVLSACQSAMVGGEDQLGSVAARLIHAGLPSVLAMTHSVLVDTTRPFLSGTCARCGDRHGSRQCPPPALCATRPRRTATGGASNHLEAAGLVPASPVPRRRRRETVNGDGA